MAEKTGIAWCDHTFNPWIGCEAISPGCANCYAKAMVENRMGKDFAVRWRTSKANWKEPLKWDRKAQADGVRRRVFCSSLADIFDNQVPDEWRADLWNVIDATPNLIWLVLTKRIGNVDKMLPGWYGASDSNLWLGATIVNQEEADRDVPKLLRSPAAKRFVSYEPALGPIRWKTESELERVDWLLGTATAKDAGGTVYPINRIDQIIVGGESGSGRRSMDMAWARSTIKQCKAAGVAVFVKQDNGAKPGARGRFTNEEFSLKEFPA